MSLAEMAGKYCTVAARPHSPLFRDTGSELRCRNLAAEAAARKISSGTTWPVPASLPQNKGIRPMTLDIVVIQPLVALIAGILILLVPRLLNYVVAIYLIVVGIIGLWPRFIHHIPH